jgi:hypothetical protein
MHELHRRPGIVRENDSLLDEVDLDIQLVQRHPVLEMMERRELLERLARTVDHRPLIHERGPLDASSRDGFEKYRSTRIGRVDSLTLATAIPRAIARASRPRAHQA